MNLGPHYFYLSVFQCFDRFRKTKFKVSHKLKHRLYGLQHNKPCRKLLEDSMTFSHLGHYSSKLITPITAWKVNLYCDLYQCPVSFFFPFPMFSQFNVKHHWDSSLYLSYKLSLLCSESTDMLFKILDVNCSYSFRLSIFKTRKLILFKKFSILIQSISSATKCNRKMFVLNI